MMAAKSNGNGQTAGQRLQALRDQIGALGKRRQELGQDLAKPDVDNAEAWVKGAAVAGAEVTAIDRALPLLQAEARAAEAQLKAARERENQDAAERMRAEVPGKLADVIKAADVLGQALDAMFQHEHGIRALGGWVPQTYCWGLRQALGTARGEWRKVWPQLMGLPPAPSREEQILADATREVERAQEALRQAERIDEGWRGELTHEKKVLIENCTSHLAWARQRVKDCEEAIKAKGNGKGPKPEVKAPQSAPIAEVITVDLAKPERKSHSSGRMVGGWEAD